MCRIHQELVGSGPRSLRRFFRTDSAAASFVTSSSLAPPSHSSSSLTTSTTTISLAANDRARHVALAHHAADQVRLSNLAKGLLSVSPNPPPSNTDNSRADQKLQLLRYTVEVEALDRGKNVQKRISVIFPIQPPAATAQQVSHHRIIRVSP